MGRSSLLLVAVVMACRTGDPAPSAPKESTAPADRSARVVQAAPLVASSDAPLPAPELSCQPIQMPAPGSCKHGSHPVASRDATSGCVTHYECKGLGAVPPGKTKSDPCPELHPPAPGFCKHGSHPVARRDATSGCVTGYECKGLGVLPQGKSTAGGPQ